MSTSYFVRNLKSSTALVAREPYAEGASRVPKSVDATASFAAC